MVRGPTWRVATQPLFLRRISVVHVYLHIAATTADPVGRNLCHLSVVSVVIYVNSVLEVAKSLAFWNHGDSLESWNFYKLHM